MRLYEAGASVDELATQLEISVRSTYRILHEHARHRGHRSPRPAREVLLADLEALDRSTALVALKYGVAQGTVANWLLKESIPYDHRGGWLVQHEKEKARNREQGEA